jgi:hypothetical protein
MDNGSETYSLLNLTQKLLDSIANTDWETYCSLTDEKVTCIEPETGNFLVEGLDFHKTYFDLPKDENIQIKENIIQPVTKVLGDLAVISYRRIRQISNIKDKIVTTVNFSETRVWRRRDVSWKMIHFHKS